MRQQTVKQQQKVVCAVWWRQFGGGSDSFTVYLDVRGIEWESSLGILGGVYTIACSRDAVHKDAHRTGDQLLHRGELRLEISPFRDPLSGAVHNAITTEQCWEQLQQQI